MKSLLIILLLSLMWDDTRATPCPAGWTESASVPGYCFQFVNDTTQNFADAKAHCKTLHPDAYLYEMRTPARQAYMASLGLNGTQIALGLIKVGMAQWVWEESGLTSAIYWKSGDPGYVATDPRECAGTYVNDPTLISDVFCQWKRKFVCEMKMPKCPCPGGMTEPALVPGYCFQFVNDTTKKFSETKVHCESLHPDAYLYEMRTPARQAYMASLGLNGTQIALGLIKVAMTKWVWEESGKTSAIYWKSGDPGFVATDPRECAGTFVNDSTEISDVFCQWKRAFICELALDNPCDCNPCLNGGTCVVGLNCTYTCSCLPGFLPPNCAPPSSFCPAGMTQTASVPGYCFKFVNKRLKKSGADGYCKTLHPDAYLYEMRTPARQAYLATLAPSPTVQIWLGLIKVAMTKWIWEGSGLDQTATPDYWKSGDPGYPATDLRECAGTYVLNQGQYSDIFCMWRRIFICEVALLQPCTPNPCLNGGVCTPGVGFTHTCACAAGFVGANCEFASCPAGWTEPALVPAYCFLFVNDTTKNFSEAKAHCNTLHPGAYLYEMRTPARQAYMASLGLNGTQIALGLIKVAMTEWIWEESWKTSAIYWKSGDPGHVATDPRECAGTFVNDTTLISDVFCQWKRAFICELALADPCKCNTCPSGTTCIPGIGHTYTCV